MKKKIKDKIPIALTVVGSISTIASTCLGIKAGMEIADLYSNDESPDMKKVIKTCIPSGITCLTAVGCDIANAVVTKKQANSLISLCSAVGSSYAAYRYEIQKRYGEEIDNDIIETISPYCDVCYMNPEIPDKKCHWIVDMCCDDIPVYELDAYERDIINVEKHFNRNYVLSGFQSAYSFFDFLNIPNIDNRIKDYGWAMNDAEIYFVDFEHTKVADGVFRITPLWAPWYDYENT